LKSLPRNVFQGLGSLKVLQLEGNPWECKVDTPVATSVFDGLPFCDDSGSDGPETHSFGPVLDQTYAPSEKRFSKEKVRNRILTGIFAPIVSLGSGIIAFVLVKACLSRVRPKPLLIQEREFAAL